jgi:LDH2 family malate/lactate/ureidoglycolate dehydrogenase
MEGRTVRVAAEELQALVVRCMEAVGCPSDHANAVAEVLVAADLRGVHSHGVNRLEMYVEEIERGEVDGKQTPQILKETVSTACVDGRNAIGMVVGQFCMKLAIQKAKQAGIGWVVAKGTNHYGIAGYYAMMASKENMMGMSFTNTSPIAFPTRSAKCVLGTNPIALAAPSSDPQDPFVLDMATTTVALGKVEVKDREEKKVPLGWGADKHGRPSEEPREILDGGGLLYLGGAEETGGYKGYGLALLVEMFCGMLSGSSYAWNIPVWRKGRGTAANLGQCFVAIDPSAFGEGFNERTSDLMQGMRALPRADESLPVLVPGDPEKRMEEEYRKNGIAFHPNLINALHQLATRLSVAPLKI